MGVHGLWKLLEPSGQMVPLESLAGKVLAVDVSIWLHQAMKGVQDGHGAPVAVAHILILFHRLCKLLFYKIKPVFVFDGGVPALKRQTMVSRRQRSTAAKSEAIKVREKLIKNLLKHEAVRQMLSDETASAVLGLNSFILPGPSVEEDLYKLPPGAADLVDSESSEAASTSDEEDERHTEDIHSIDVNSHEFLSLPAEVRHDILTELIETRKQSSWKYLDSMPKKSDNFSDFQMNRLLKRHAVQTSLEKAGKEMGGRALSLKELESLLGDKGVLDPNVDLPSKRIAQDNVTRYMLVQKDSETGEGEKFDIMNHLEDVEWSSESDTDIILEKTSSKRSAVVKKEPEVQEVKKEASDTSKREFCSISKETKVRVTDEIADILSVLEDKNVEGNLKVKLESLQSQLRDCKRIGSVEVKVEEKEVEVDDKLIEAQQGLQVSCVRPQEDIEMDIVEKVEGKQKERIYDVEVLKGDNLEGAKTEEKILVDENEPEPPVGPSNEKGEESDSSSNSESDFIPITDSETRDFSLENEANQEVKSLVEETSESKPFTVVINPSEMGNGEDLFADVFQKSANPESEEETKNSKDEDRATAEEIIKKYKAEFEASGDLKNLKKTLEEEQESLAKEKGKQERLAANMSDHMYSDAQELLRLFGVPFVIAPMEAEAQCATLNIIGLTEGTITDDSDIWLFGGRVVYKNFFNQNKHVLEYRSENIQKYFKLSREDMIRMALLVGSDYTIGLNGIGPVTALEILAAFQTPNQGFIDGLKKFREWYLGGSKTGPPRTTLRKKIKNAVIYPGFPNAAVVEAYLHPQVDDSKEPFSWAKPNLDLIRNYVKAKLGWSAEKCNELLLPVLRKLEEKTGQTTIDKHFKIIQKDLKVGMMSKRVENAIKRLGGDSVEETVEQEPKRKRSRKVKETESAAAEGGSEKKVEHGRSEFEGFSENIPASQASRLKFIKEKLHRNVRVPQRERAQKELEERKKEAIKIFRTYRKGKQKKKVFAKAEANLSEDSSEEEAK